mmetsp:Transcript_32827/g.97812  ORF Transcript_32827/g.97812 Transcript_32827/m.97812 type:complete len:227 (-) Transcript_32827:540-1220(-)
MAQVDITPPDLRFKFSLNKQLLGTISLNNSGSKRAAFKIKTTAPKKYVVRPSSGIVEGNGSTSVQVIMQAQKEYPVDFSNCKDKFMVQIVELGDGEQVDPGSTFNKDLKGDALKESRLRVVLEGPAASAPSPVPEGEESNTAVDGSRLKTAYNDLAATSQENNYLKAKVDKLKSECDSLRKQLDNLQLTTSASTSQASSSRPKIGLLHIIIAAIIAFLIGQYIGNM